MRNFFVWTVGCQMNRADSERTARYLRGWGLAEVAAPEQADLVVVNSCVVRQSAENRVAARLHALSALKQSRPGLALALTGCLVGDEEGELRQRFPGVDLFFPPQDFSRLAQWLGRNGGSPPLLSSPPPSAFVPVIQGCDNFCTYCIVPYRRGRERSRPVAEVEAEVRGLVAAGAREVVLLGQNINAYGHDLPGRPDLAYLLAVLNGIDGLGRIRFLTSHPRDITDGFIQAVASLDKVCPSFSLPLQAGDDGILQEMGRGYTVAAYRGLVGRIREAIPGAGLSTDVIVGFPGETEAQFEGTLSLVRELRFDTVHIAGYSPRPGTAAAQKLSDNVPPAEKKQRQRKLEALQQEMAREINAGLVGKRVTVLAERKSPQGRWQGRTPSGKLVFFPGREELCRREVVVRVEAAGPWWLEGHLEAMR